MRQVCDYWQDQQRSGGLRIKILSSPCRHPECQYCKTKTGCNSGDTCLFPHYKVDEQPNKRPKKEESEDKSAVAVVTSVSQLGCVSQDSDALASQGTKVFRSKPMQKVLNAIQRVRLTKSTLRHASIQEKKGSSLGKIQVKPRHQRSPYSIKIRGSVPRRD